VKWLPQFDVAIFHTKKQLTMNSKIKGWQFLKRPKTYAADGSTTLDNLRAEKTKLESRLAQIPGLIAQIQNSIKVTQQDIDWLNGLNNRRKKDWEKENGGKRVEDVVYEASKKIVGWNATISNLNSEKSRIPEQLKAVDRQLEALVQGESKGLSKGLSSDMAKELGELELKKEQNNIIQEQQLKAIELEKARSESEKAKQQISPILKWSLIIGSVLLLSIIAYIVYKKRSLKLAQQVTPNIPINPSIQ